MKPTVFNYQEYLKLKEEVDGIVRCGECIYSEEAEIPIPGRWCNRFAGVRVAVGDKSYCSFGERESDG